MLNSELDKHLELHEGKELFQCNICNAKFVSSNGLIGHVSAVHERPSGDNFVAEFDEKVPKINDSKEGQNLPPPNYEIATDQFKATCHYCDKIYHNEETLKMHLTSHRIELNQ